MLAYIVRRLLLIIPTLFGIMVINFVIIQAAPGGPVEQMIAQIKGNAGGATRARHRRRRRARRRRRSRRRRPAAGPVSQYRGARGLDPGADQGARAAVRLRQAAARALPPDDAELSSLRFRRELLPRPAGGRSGAREAAGLDLARPVDDAAHLPDLDPARHRQGGARRQPLRRLDQRRHHRRLRHPELPVRDPADRAVRRRQLLRLVPACAGWSPRTGAACPGRRRSSTISGTSTLPVMAHGDRRLRQPDHADQELLPRRDQQAVRADRARQGPDASGGCSTAMSSATPC